MKKWKKKMAVLVASLVLALGLCGCALETSAENLFTLPEVPVEYTGLSNTLNTYLKSGYEYINPTGGSNMQSLQMIDLDGDGSKEAVAFFRCASDEKPLKILFFRSPSFAPLSPAAPPLIPFPSGTLTATASWRWLWAGALVQRCRRWPCTACGGIPPR